MRRPYYSYTYANTLSFERGRHTLWKLLWRWRPELESDRARHDPQYSQQPAPRDPAPTGQFVRDYFYHVEDGAAAYMLLAEKMAGNKALKLAHAFNFFNEIQVTVLDLCQSPHTTHGLQSCAGRQK